MCQYSFSNVIWIGLAAWHGQQQTFEAYETSSSYINELFQVAVKASKVILSLFVLRNQGLLFLQ